MFLVNVVKLLKVFPEVYVSSDCRKMLKQAEGLGAKGIYRDEDMCGDVPNIPVYQYCMKEMGDVDGIVAVQSCSPNVAEKLLVTTRGLLELGFKEVMTCHPLEHLPKYHDQNSKIYGSIWAVSKERLLTYKDPYKPTPEVLLVDTSEDIHYYDDYDMAVRNAIHN